MARAGRGIEAELVHDVQLRWLTATRRLLSERGALAVVTCAGNRGDIGEFKGVARGELIGL